MSALEPLELLVYAAIGALIGFFSGLLGIGGGAVLQWGLGLVVGAFPETAGEASAYRTLFLLTGTLVAAASLGYAPLGRKLGAKRVTAT